MPCEEGLVQFGCNPGECRKCGTAGDLDELFAGRGEDCCEEGNACDSELAQCLQVEAESFSGSPTCNICGGQEQVPCSGVNPSTSLTAT